MPVHRRSAGGEIFTAGLTAVNSVRSGKEYFLPIYDKINDIFLYLVEFWVCLLCMSLLQLRYSMNYGLSKPLGNRFFRRQIHRPNFAFPVQSLPVGIGRWSNAYSSVNTQSITFNVLDMPVGPMEGFESLSKPAPQHAVMETSIGAPAPTKIRPRTKGLFGLQTNTSLCIQYSLSAIWWQVTWLLSKSPPAHESNHNPSPMMRRNSFLCWIARQQRLPATTTATTSHNDHNL